MQDQVKAPPAPKRVPWNKGKLTGAKPPLRPEHVWSIRTKLQIEGRARDLEAASRSSGSEAGDLNGEKSLRWTGSVAVAQLARRKSKINIFAFDVRLA